MKFYNLLILFILVGCSKQGVMNATNPIDDSQQILFTVGDTPVTNEEFIYVYKKNNVNNDSAFTRADVADYLDLYIKFKLKIEEAINRGMDTTKGFYDEFNTYQEQLKKPYLTETKVTDSLIQEAYGRMKKEINASHILIKVPENADPEDTLAAYQKATQIREKALAGESFEDLAKEYSEDPSAKTNGGNLGYFTSFQMVYPFESAAYKTAKGEVSDLVRTRFGYHIIKVLDVREAQGTVEVSHIMVRMKPTSADSTAAKNKIFEIHEQATGGVPWNELASQFSDDINTKDKGGRLRPFSVGQMPLAFQETAFSLLDEGQISDPFMTPYGWHIVRLEKRNPLKPFADLEQTIKSRINRDSRAKLNKKVLVNRLKKENNYTLITEISDFQDRYFDSLLIQGKWQRPQIREDENTRLFSIGTRSYTLNNFLDFVELKQKNNSYKLDQYIQLLYDDFEEEKIISYEDDQLEEKYIDYRMLVKEYREGILLFQLMEEEVWAKAVEDTVGLERFFEQNRKKYTWKERVQASVYNAADSTILKDIKRRIESDQSVEAVVLDSLYNQQSSIALQVENGKYEKGNNDLIDSVPWKPGYYERENDGRYNLIIIEEVLEAGPKALNETRGLVISDYQKQLEELWLVQLRAKYPVEVNEKGEKAIYNELL